MITLKCLKLIKNRKKNIKKRLKIKNKSSIKNKIRTDIENEKKKQVSVSAINKTNLRQKVKK